MRVQGLGFKSTSVCPNIEDLARRALPWRYTRKLASWDTQRARAPTLAPSVSSNRYGGTTEVNDVPLGGGPTGPTPARDMWIERCVDAAREGAAHRAGAESGEGCPTACLRCSLAAGVRAQLAPYEAPRTCNSHIVLAKGAY